MDLLTLPDEMLARVAAYTKLAKLREIRKKNKRIDLVSRRFDCHRVPVKSLRIDSSETSVELCKSTFGPQPRSVNVNLEECLPKIKILQGLEFWDVRLDEQMLTIMKKNGKCFKNVSCLQLTHVSCFLPKNVVKSQFWDICPKITNLFVVASFSEAICNKEVLQRRKWKYLNIQKFPGLGDNSVRIDKDFLFAVVPSCDKFYLYGPDNFTVKDAVLLLKICTMKRRIYNQSITIDDVKLGEISEDDTDNEVRKMFESNIDGSSIVVIIRRSYRVELQKASRGYEFVIHVEDEE